MASQGGYYFKWKRWREAHNAFMLGDRPLGQYFTDDIPRDTDEISITEAYCAVKKMVKERRFMLTQGGRMGWAPDDMHDETGNNQVKVGDLVAIVFGCSTPLIIRCHLHRYQVVGEAYVEGVMDGEAVSLLQEGVHKRESFLFE